MRTDEAGSFLKSGDIFRFSLVDEYSSRNLALHELRKKALARSKKEGISIPFPTSAVRLKKE